MPDIDERSLEFLFTAVCNRQWRPFLQALAKEMNAQLPDTERRGLFYAMGRRMVEYLPTPDASDLKRLEASINEAWRAIDWGLVQVDETDDFISITHYCSPLRAAFGAESLVWTPALLEGVYAEWFAALGAGEDLVLRQHGDVTGADDAIEYRLAPDAQA
ncbi:cellulose biosynthesis protein BcsD [Salinisphaera sp. PC39]|uniref:cellulose biosynthesis protein BcsD n=1 Tax=Salinisphaera sp. PC39 TaxID=1304156 RepID=UPI003341F311